MTFSTRGLGAGAFSTRGLGYLSILIIRGILESGGSASGVDREGTAAGGSRGATVEALTDQVNNLTGVERQALLDAVNDYLAGVEGSVDRMRQLFYLYELTGTVRQLMEELGETTALWDELGDIADLLEGDSAS